MKARGRAAFHFLHRQEKYYFFSYLAHFLPSLLYFRIYLVHISVSILEIDFRHFLAAKYLTRHLVSLFVIRETAILTFQHFPHASLKFECLTITKKLAFHDWIICASSLTSTMKFAINYETNQPHWRKYNSLLLTL